MLGYPVEHDNKNGRGTARHRCGVLHDSRLGARAQVLRRGPRFRAERIVEGEELPARFTRDDAFDLEAHWRESNAAMQRPMEWYEAVLHVTNEALEWVVSSNENSIVASDERGKTLRMRFPSQRVAVYHIAGWGTSVRVLEPAELIASVAEHARELVGIYGTSAPVFSV
jgi:predicted DNA-binding transcriptional regulator YafY